ncbi:hypothetical protein [Adlercreutzia sp. ZJ176]|uniref:hypothetical protein n=1 Tax=Adlercreutzia sp. ZJ176 TaxID=2709407 RepID=UPI00198086B8|nr:hypothetical protein [Adlercreutzia sp. ZJ176]
MCFRPPEAAAGEIVCPGCYIVVMPNPDGTCPECGAMMRPPAGVARPGAPGAPAAPGAPGMPAAPAAPGAPGVPAAPGAPVPPPAPRSPQGEE